MVAAQQFPEKQHWHSMATYTGDTIECDLTSTLDVGLTGSAPQTGFDQNFQVSSRGNPYTLDKAGTLAAGWSSTTTHNSNEGIRRRIVDQAGRWYAEALEALGFDASRRANAFFPLGKILHMVRAA